MRYGFQRNAVGLSAPTPAGLVGFQRQGLDQRKKNGVATTWSPFDKSASVTLSGDARTATNTPGLNGYNSVRGLTSRAWGSWRFEVTVLNASAGPGVGVANALAALDDPNFVGVDANGITWFANNTVFRSNANQGSFQTFAAGDVLAVEADFDHLLVFFQKLGGVRSAGYSIAGASGPWFPSFTGFEIGSAVALNPIPVMPATPGFNVWS